MPGPSEARPAGAVTLPARFGPWAPPSRAAVVATCGIAAVLFLAYLAGPTLAQFAIGLILVLVLDPVETWLSRRGLNRGIAYRPEVPVRGLRDSIATRMTTANGSRVGHRLPRHRLRGLGQARRQVHMSCALVSAPAFDRAFFRLSLMVEAGSRNPMPRSHRLRVAECCGVDPAVLSVDRTA